MKTIFERDNLKVPTYAIPYLVNGDSSGLNEQDKHVIDLWFNDYQARVQENESLIFSVNPEVIEQDDGTSILQEQEPQFTWKPEFGLACDVMICTILIVS